MTMTMTHDADLPTPAIYLPTETGEGQKLLRLNPLAAEGVNVDDFLAGAAKLAASLMADHVDAEQLPRVVWPLRHEFDGSDTVEYQCQASGEVCTPDAPDDDVTFDSEESLMTELAGWVQATIA